MAEDSPARRDPRPRPDAPARQPSGADIGWSVTGTMLSGIVVWGGVGLALDRWWGTRFVALIGAIFGLTVAIYLIVVKYGAVESPPPAGRRPARATSTRRTPRPGQTQKG